MDESTRQQISILTILHSACAVALDAFHAAGNGIDRQLISDLERMVERTRLEIDGLRHVL